MKNSKIFQLTLVAVIFVGTVAGISQMVSVHKTYALCKVDPNPSADITGFSVADVSSTVAQASTPYSLTFNAGCSLLTVDYTVIVTGGGYTLGTSGSVVYCSNGLDCATPPDYLGLAPVPNTLLNVAGLPSGTYTATLYVGRLPMGNPPVGYDAHQSTTFTINYPPLPPTRPSFSNVVVSANPVVGSGIVSGDLDGGWEHRNYTVHEGGTLLLCQSRLSDSVDNILWSIDDTTYGNAISSTQTLAGSPPMSPLSGDPEPYCGSNYWTNDFEYSFSVPIDTSSLSPGPHTLYLEATDGAGTGTTSFQFTVAAPVPNSPSITIANTSVSGNTLTLSGTAAAGWDSGTITCVNGGKSVEYDNESEDNFPLTQATWGINGSGSNDFFSDLSVMQAGHSLKYTCTNGTLNRNPAFQRSTYAYTLSMPVPSTGSTITLTVTDADGEVAQATYVYTNIATGAISVTSEDANNPSILVPAKWDLTGQVGNGFVCGDTPTYISSFGSALLWSGVPCSGDEQSYSNVPANNDPVGILPTMTTDVPNYSFNSIERIPIAENKRGNNFVGSFALSLKNILSTVAEAVTVSPVGSLALTPSSPSVAFTILWNPLVADMQVSPNNISFASSGSMSQVETITATGAPSANLDWTASASTVSGGNWLSVPSGGTVQVDGSGSGTGSATVSADAGSLSNGTYTGTVTFKGYNDNNGNPGTYVTTRTVSVTLTVGSGSTPITVSCNPTTVSTNGTSQCTATGGDGSGYMWTISSGSGTIGSSSGLYTAPGTSGSATITATASDNPGLVSPPVTITVNAGSGGPYFACAAGVCEATSSSSGGSSCINACGGGGGSGGGSALSATCAPGAVTLSPLETSQCVLKLNGVTQDGSWTLSSGSTGSIGATSGVYTPSAVGTETVIGTLPDGTSADATITVNAGGPPPLPACTPGVNCPVCSTALIASPSSIVVPESSNLSYSCSNVTECQLVNDGTGQILQDIGSGSSSTITINTTANPYAVSPTAPTAYTLTCVNSNYTPNANNPSKGSATVTVNGSSYCETDPNGIGCP